MSDRCHSGYTLGDLIDDYHDGHDQSLRRCLCDHRMAVALPENALYEDRRSYPPYDLQRSSHLRIVLNDHLSQPCGVLDMEEALYRAYELAAPQPTPLAESP